MVQCYDFCNTVLDISLNDAWSATSTGMEGLIRSTGTIACSLVSTLMVSENSPINPSSHESSGSEYPLSAHAFNSISSDDSDADDFNMMNLLIPIGTAITAVFVVAIVSRRRSPQSTIQRKEHRALKSLKNRVLKDFEQVIMGDVLVKTPYPKDLKNLKKGVYDAYDAMDLQRMFNGKVRMRKTSELASFQLIPETFDKYKSLVSQMSDKTNLSIDLILPSDCENTFKEVANGDQFPKALIIMHPDEDNNPHVTPVIIHKPQGANKAEIFIFDSLGGGMGNVLFHCPYQGVSTQGKVKPTLAYTQHLILDACLQKTGDSDASSLLTPYFSLVKRQASPAGCHADAILVSRSILLNLQKTPSKSLGEHLGVSSELVGSEVFYLLAPEIPLEWTYTSELLNQELYTEEDMQTTPTQHNPKLSIKRFREINSRKIKIYYHYSGSKGRVSGEATPTRFNYLMRKTAEWALRDEALSAE